MKVSRGVLLICLLTLVALGCESAIQQLNSITELKEVFSDESVPLHSLTLLHWFANNVDINNNNVVRLTFDTRGDFGSHCYGNYEGLLPPALRRHQYCSIGNVNPTSRNRCPSYQTFPDYVLNPPVIDPEETVPNRDRIIVSVQAQNTHNVNQVYLTQHYTDYSQGSAYDPDHTYIISTNLIQELRLFSFDDSQSLQELRDQFDNNIDDNRLNDLINRWGRDQAPLGLLYEIVTRQRINLGRVSVREARDLSLKMKGDRQNCEILQMHVRVITGSNGKAKIIWKNVPRNWLNEGVTVALFKNNKDEGGNFWQIQSSEGSYQTSVPLNEGLQVRLHKIVRRFIYWKTIKEEICRGAEYKSPKAVSVTGYAQLQLFVRNGKACFRLYVKKGCSNQWKSSSKNCWVGLYTSAGKAPRDFRSLQWESPANFKRVLKSGEFNTFEHCTSTKVTPGLQARFMMKNFEERAYTPVWH